MGALQGKRTYIVVALFLAAVIVPIVARVPIPVWVYGILEALGLAAIRAAVAAVSGNQGWKTYAAAGVVALVSIANAVGLALPLDLILSVVGALGIAGVRDAVNKLAE